MAVGGTRLVDRVLELETLYDGRRAQVEEIPDPAGDEGVGRFSAVSRDGGCAVGVHEDAHRLRHADRVRYLYETFFRHSGRHEVLGDVPCRVGGGPVHLGRILAGERPAAVGSAPAVGVDDDFAPREARVPGRAADDELAGRVHMKYELVVKQPRRLLGEGGYESRYHDVAHVLLYAIVHLGVGAEVVVLCAEHNGVHAYRLVLLRELDSEL